MADGDGGTSSPKRGTNGGHRSTISAQEGGADDDYNSQASNSESLYKDMGRMIALQELPHNFKFEDVGTYTQRNITFYTMECFRSYENSDLINEDLLIAYQEDFADWDGEMFLVLDKSVRRDVKYFLRERGIYLPVTGRTHEYLVKILTGQLEAWSDENVREIQQRHKIRSNRLLAHYDRLHSSYEGSIPSSVRESQTANEAMERLQQASQGQNNNLKTRLQNLRFDSRAPTFAEQRAARTGQRGFSSSKIPLELNKRTQQRLSPAPENESRRADTHNNEMHNESTVNQQELPDMRIVPTHKRITSPEKRFTYPAQKELYVNNRRAYVESEPATPLPIESTGSAAERVAEALNETYRRAPILDPTSSEAQHFYNSLPADTTRTVEAAKPQNVRMQQHYRASLPQTTLPPQARPSTIPLNGYRQPFNEYNQPSEEPPAYNYGPANPRLPPTVPPEGYYGVDHTATWAASEAKKIQELHKMYVHDDKNKYSGDLMDNLQMKLAIFENRLGILDIGASQLHKAFPAILKGKAHEFYFRSLNGLNLTFPQLLARLRAQFESRTQQDEARRMWNNATIEKSVADPANSAKTKIECFEDMVEKLRNLAQILYPNDTDEMLRNQIHLACQNDPDCQYAYLHPSDNVEGLVTDIRSSLASKARIVEHRGTFLTGHEQFPVDRQYGRHPSTQRGNPRYGQFGQEFSRGGLRRGGGFRRDLPRMRPNPNSFQKRCFICGKPGCWSTRHSKEEQRNRKRKWQEHQQSRGETYMNEDYEQFLCEQEGLEHVHGIEDDDDILMEQMLLEHHDVYEGNDEEYTQEHSPEQFLTSFGKINGQELVSVLQNNSTEHAVICSRNADKEENLQPANYEVFMMQERYGPQEFHGIIPDTGAAGKSTGGYGQYQALLRLLPDLELDITEAGSNIHFGAGQAATLGVVQVPTPLGTIAFHILPTTTPFLLSIDDMDIRGIMLNNLENTISHGDVTIPIIRKWGHPWMILDVQLYQGRPELNYAFLTEKEIRRLHRRLGHPSVPRFREILMRSNHDFTQELLEKVKKYCHECQLNGDAPRRFKFNIREKDLEFNSEVIVDTMFIKNKPTLHLVDAATAFQAARFLKNKTAPEVWRTLRACWIDTYLGPPDVIVHDAGLEYANRYFRGEAQLMGTAVREVPVEAHHSVGQIERYHRFLLRAFEIFETDLQGYPEDDLLQMAVKAVNDTAGPRGLVPTLLVFGAYPRLTADSAPSGDMTKRAATYRKAMEELRKLSAQRITTDALSIPSGPNTLTTTTLPIGSKVVVWREKRKWTGPFKLVAIEGQRCIVEMQQGHRTFRSTHVRPYYEGSPMVAPAQEEDSPQKETRKGPDHMDQDATDNQFPPETDHDEIETTPLVKRSPGRTPMLHIGEIINDSIPIKRGRGRPKGSKNRVHVQFDAGQFILDYHDVNEEIIDDVDQLLQEWAPEGVIQKCDESFLTAKEAADLELSKKLRAQGIITTPGEPFEASDQAEMDGLVSAGVFKFEIFDAAVHGNMRIFKARIVREIKGKATTAPYEKSRIVVQGYSDDGKATLLTQAPTIQRVSQRLIVAITPMLSQNRGMRLALRDIAQAYPQSKTALSRIVYCRLPPELEHKYPNGTILLLLKPLYGLAESGLHWFVTYSTHHLTKLKMRTSTYDPCLFITQLEATEKGITGLQTDDSLMLGDTAFLDLEQAELQNAGFRAQDRTYLTHETPLIFNGCITTLQENGDVLLQQKEQGKKIALVTDSIAESIEDQYRSQRARAAYIASICQPEASFDCSIAAQVQEVTEKAVNDLNKRLKWSMDNLTRGLRYIPLNPDNLKLYVFVDGSFANLPDMSSQLGFVMVLGNEVQKEESFEIRGNLLHWSSTKSKRITRSALASELLAMVQGADLGIAVSTTLDEITQKVECPRIPIVVCTDSLSLYECLVKLGTTAEKRLMIDLLHLRQSYEQRQLQEIRWISGGANPADAMTKANPNSSLRILIDTNQLDIPIQGWVKRKEPAAESKMVLCDEKAEKEKK